MGGWNQSQAHAQFVMDLADYKMNIQAAMEAPRFTKITFAGCGARMENRFLEKTRDELKGKGHEIKLLGTFSSKVGGGLAVGRGFAAGARWRASGSAYDWG